MFSEQFFDLLLDFGDDWKVNQVSVNSLTEEVDATIEFISKVAEDPDTLEGCPLAHSKSVLHLVLSVW